MFVFAKAVPPNKIIFFKNLEIVLLIRCLIQNTRQDGNSSYTEKIYEASNLHQDEVSLDYQDPPEC